jgi:transcriptional regulator with XRE-family HTH domain
MNVRRLRRTRSWTQEHLAAVSGVSRAEIQRIEAGRVTLRPETAQKLAAAFDTDAAAIRATSGLVAAVSRVMAITFDRDATEEEPRGLSPTVHETFSAFYAARTEHDASLEALRRTSEALTAAGTAASEASGVKHENFLRFVRTGGDHVALRAYEESDARVTAMAAAERDANDAFLQAQHRLAAAAERFMRTGLDISRLLVSVAAA